MNAPVTRVYFLGGPDPRRLAEAVQGLGGLKDPYEILETVPVAGQSRVKVEAGQFMARIETAESFSSNEHLKFKGTLRHLQYTPSEVRSELQTISAGIYPASDSTLAVLIPIRKSESWWALSQDERQKHFEKHSTQRTHTRIGYDYAAQIYRRLYHSRYLESNPPLDYDFLTYFEFDRKDRGLFRQLLAELRNTEINPEWKYVEFELEIWMLKRGKL